MRVPLRLEFVAEVRQKLHEARAGVVAERKAREDAAEHRELMAWNRAENRRLHELRCVGRGAGRGRPAGRGAPRAPLSLGPLPLAG